MPHEVTLADELEMLDCYLEIERARFGDRITIAVVLDDNASASLVPPFVLQPLVENAIHHGAGKREDGGLVRVEISMKEGTLQIEVSDNGPGVPPERRAELFEFGKTTKVGGSGIGLPLSQLIVESHGGTLVYQDRNGSSRGATFRLTLLLEELH